MVLSPTQTGIIRKLVDGYILQYRSNGTQKPYILTKDGASAEYVALVAVKALLQKGLLDEKREGAIRTTSITKAGIHAGWGLGQ